MRQAKCRFYLFEINKNFIFELGMTIIAELLLSGDKRDHIVYVVDFNGSFRMERLVEIFTQRMCQAGENTSNYIGEALLNQIRCSKAISSYELEIRLLELEVCVFWHDYE